MLRELLAVGIGGAAGSMVRYMLSGHLLSGCTFGGLPIGTLTVNVAGSLLIGLFSGWLGDSPWSMRLLTVGFCGGFTTFSTFSADALRLLRNAEWTPALLYIALSVVLCIVCAAIGMWIGGQIRQ